MTLEDVEAYVRECVANGSPPRVSELARNMAVSAVTLNRAFKANSAMTISAYMRERRHAIAAELLTRTSLSATRVGYHAGYGTRRTFHRSFALREGATPHRYRSRHRR